MLETVSGLQVILAVTPVILLIVLLGFLKLPGEKSASITLVVTALIALFGFNLSLIDTSLSVVYGIVKAIFPILIIILMAI